MPDKYCKEDEKRLKKQRLKEEGIEINEEDESNDLERRECGRCGENWPPTQKYCGNCSLALTKNSAKEVKELQEAGDKVVNEELNGVSRQEIVQQMNQLEDKVQKMQKN
jgi:hypothetical protein